MIVGNEAAPLCFLFYLTTTAIGAVPKASHESLHVCLLLQVVHILNMTTAQVHSFQLSPEESLHSLQKRIEAETKIEVVNQELLQETGVSLDPRKPAAQCVLDGVVSKKAVFGEKKNALLFFFLFVVSCFFLLFLSISAQNRFTLDFTFSFHDIQKHLFNFKLF